MRLSILGSYIENLIKRAVEFTQETPKREDQTIEQYTEEMATTLELSAMMAGQLASLERCFEQIIDHLDLNQPEAAREYAASMLNNNAYISIPVGAVPFLGAFEQAFKTACRKNNVPLCAYVMLTDHRRLPDGRSAYTIRMGGNHVAESYVTRGLQPIAAELGAETKRPFDIDRIAKQGTWNAPETVKQVYRPNS